MTVADAIKTGTKILTDSGVDTPCLDAQLLLAWTMACRREDLAREPERALSDADCSRFSEALDRRVRRMPLPYITGVRHFFGREFHVDEHVLIPRPETEILVEHTLERIVEVECPRIVDVGTGSGCIAVTLAAERKDAQVWATDISPEALAVASANATSTGVDDRVTLIEGDLLTPFLSAFDPFHVVVSNPPYVAIADMIDLQLEVRDFEPKLALIGEPGATGESGTLLYPRLFEQARRVLVDGGSVLVEIGFGQADDVMAPAIVAGFIDVDVVSDFAGIPRVVTGRLNND